MREIIISADLTFNLDTLDESPDDYDYTELVEILRIHLQEAMYQNDLEVTIYDYRVEDDEVPLEFFGN